ncbi:hypothetical protein ZOSMA_1071G00010 [Zostera marina]|uniref:Uncharacterized protein n=1 Tax=Zostera marina TaxID=29655 RepID=A0A0K9Q605_ZOSMR|nr:hypothetical protein ZOSMA_1071G00010 [Zostera marina]
MAHAYYADFALPKLVADFGSLELSLQLMVEHSQISCTLEIFKCILCVTWLSFQTNSLMLSHFVFMR